jgi:ubiquinone/menaquinone biosynthesis C-methylase UbiE
MGDATDRLWVGSMPEAYERWLGPSVFQPFAADLARRVGTRRPQRVLELAAGTGIVTRELLAAVEGAEITATDLNDAMVQFGSGLAPGARWRQADALNLPFEDGQFDTVVCQFGVMFFPDKVAAYTEARRVLAPGGSLLFNSWGTVEEHDFGAAVIAGLKQAFPDDPPTFLSDIPHGYSDVDAVLGHLRAAGFESVSAETITLVGRAASAGDVATGFCTGTPLRPAIEARADLAATTAAVTEVMEAQLGSGEVSSRMVAHVFDASARL